MLTGWRGAFPKVCDELVVNIWSHGGPTVSHLSHVGAKEKSGDLCTVPNVTNLVFRERALFFSWLSLVGFSLLCNFRQHRVATQECDDPDHDEVLEGGEHAHVEPEEVVQAEDGA